MDASRVENRIKLIFDSSDENELPIDVGQYFIFDHKKTRRVTETARLIVTNDVQEIAERTALNLRPPVISSANNRNIAIFSEGDCRRRRGKPQLIHGRQPHEGEAQTHQRAAPDHDPSERMIELGEIPRADIQYDGDIGKCDNGALEPDGPHEGVAVHQPHDEEDKGQSEQVNVRDANKGRNIGARVFLRHFLQVVIPREVWKMRIAAVVTSHATLIEGRSDVLVIDRTRSACLRPIQYDRTFLRR